MKYPCKMVNWHKLPCFAVLFFFSYFHKILVDYVYIFNLNHNSYMFLSTTANFVPSEGWQLKGDCIVINLVSFFSHLGQMRSLRVFYSNTENTQGQIVIASRESQYKILHFHHGGLDKLAEIFQDWSLFANAQEKTVCLTLLPSPRHAMPLQTVQIQISWCLKKPTAVDLHCLSFSM